MSEFFFHFAFAQMLMCAILLFPLHKQNVSIKLFILLMITGCGYLLSSIISPVQHSLLWWLGHLGGNALPGVFWLVSLRVFGNHKELKPWQFFVASLTLLIPLFAQFLDVVLNVSISQYEAIYGVLKYGGLLLEMVLIGHALTISLLLWRDDLVQDRRYIRGGVITVTGLYIIMVIVLEQLLQVQWQGLAYFKGLLLAMLTTSVNFVLFQLKDASLFDTLKSEESSTHSSHGLSKELTKIISAMEQEKLYQQDGLTISAFASHLAIHEYKLRALINGELNYRNFNDFLNHYRVKEVSQLLLDEETRTTPVLTLALESGFRSLSSFNKAFKAIHGVTPTEYRKNNLAGV